MFFTVMFLSGFTAFLFLPGVMNTQLSSNIATINAACVLACTPHPFVHTVMAAFYAIKAVLLVRHMPFSSAHRWATRVPYYALQAFAYIEATRLAPEYARAEPATALLQALYLMQLPVLCNGLAQLLRESVFHPPACIARAIPVLVQVACFFFQILYPLGTVLHMQSPYVRSGGRGFHLAQAIVLAVSFRICTFMAAAREAWGASMQRQRGASFIRVGDAAASKMPVGVRPGPD